MKTVFLFVGVSLSIILTSCNKCYECDFGSLSTEYCEEDFSSNELDNLETACENNGGDWHLSVD